MAQYPVITAGTRLTADLLSSMLPNYVIKTSDTTRASTTTMTNDPDLVTDSLSAGGIYFVEFHIRFGALLAAGLRTAWSVPAGTTGSKDVMGPGTANAAEANANTTELKWTVHAYATAALYTDPRNNAAQQTHLYEKGLVNIGGTAGPITLQWAQNVSNATGSVVNAQSFVRWQQVG
jgi:hypothetical protein